MDAVDVALTLEKNDEYRRTFKEFSVEFIKSIRRFVKDENNKKFGGIVQSSFLSNKFFVKDVFLQHLKNSALEVNTKGIIPGKYKNQYIESEIN